MSSTRNPQDIQLDETSIKYEEIEYPDIRTLFKYFSKGRDNIEIKELVQTLSKHGFHYEQPRWKEYIDELNKYQKIDIQAFQAVFKHHLILLNQASPTEHELIIPEFQHFKNVLGIVFQQVRSNLKGDVTKQIPLLSKVNPDLFGMTVCTIDGQMQFYGDYKQNFSLQSCHTPISYGIALELLGENYVHEYVGQEPSGDLYDSHILTREGKPYNPLVNAGAITITSLLLSHYKNEPSDAYEGLIKWWQRLIGHGRPGFNNAIYLSEKHAADRNRALIYFLRGQGVFPVYKQDYCLEEQKSGSGSKEKILTQSINNIDFILDFYFQCCSIEMNTFNLSIVAATLANGGVNPMTHERVFSIQTTRYILSIMFTCGLNNQTGQFSFQVGVPAKSGISGALMVVVPGVIGFCIYSPRIDDIGNSPRAVELCYRMLDRFQFHSFDSHLIDDGRRSEVRLLKRNLKNEQVVAFLYSCYEGDMETIKYILIKGFDINQMDYDKRTGLHLAAAQGKVEVVKYLLENGGNAALRDRYGRTPLDEAMLNGNEEVIAMLSKAQLKGTIKSPLDSLLTPQTPINGIQFPSDQKTQIQKFNSSEVQKIQQQYEYPQEKVQKPLYGSNNQQNYFLNQQFLDNMKISNQHTKTHFQTQPDEYINNSFNSNKGNQSLQDSFIAGSQSVERSQENNTFLQYKYQRPAHLERNGSQQSLSSSASQKDINLNI